MWAKQWAKFVIHCCQLQKNALSDRRAKPTNGSPYKVATNEFEILEIDPAVFAKMSTKG